MELEAKYLVSGELEVVEKRICEVFPSVRNVGTVDLPAIYYDTLDGRLGQAKSALRVREEQGRLIGCYKATTRESRKFVEEELEVSREELDGQWFIRLNHYADIVQAAGGEEVIPMVKIETKRKILVLEWEDAGLEIALDWVNYLGGEAFEERVEVELKYGTMQAFEGFLRRFEEEITGLTETNVSKYQKAKELLRKSV